MKAATLVEDTLTLLEELLTHARWLDDAEYRRAKKTVPVRTPKVKVVVSRVGSPGRHPPVTFTEKCGCLVCRRPIWTGCGNPACGHVHKGTCWLTFHSAVGQTRK